MFDRLAPTRERSVRPRRATAASAERAAAAMAMQEHTMVYIPVDHEHARHVQTLPCVLRSYRDVVEQAEAHRTAGFGMVAGRPHLPERSL